MSLFEWAIQTDYYKYLAYNWSWPKCLEQSVPIGYPLFLKLIRLFDPLLVSLPFIQLGLIILTLFFLGWVLYKISHNFWFVVCGAVPIFFAPALALNWVEVSPECLSGLLVVLTVALVILSYGDDRFRVWMALAASVFIGYQMKVILVSLIPLVCLFRWDRRAWIAAIVPYILFCSLRLVVVGDFSVCSDGGIQTCGYVASLMPDSKIPWQFHILPRETDRIYYSAWHYRDVYIRETKAKMGNSLENNRQLSHFTRQMILAHPKAYLDRVGRSFIVCMEHWPQPIFTIEMMLLIIALTFYRQWLGSVPFTWHEREWAFFCAIGIAHLLMQSAMLSLCTFPDDRYLHLAYIFVPSILCSTVYENIRRIGMAHATKPF